MPDAARNRKSATPGSPGPVSKRLRKKTGASDARFRLGKSSGYRRDTVETCRSIDVNQLHREGCLRPGWLGVWKWEQDGEKVGSITMRAAEGRLVLRYNCRRPGDEWESVRESVPIVQVPCGFGGMRPYFRCPGVVNGIACGRRVTKLYGPGKYFLCRHCYGLVYQSQSEGEGDRAQRRANRIRMQLGGDPGIASPFPPRPKGMWRRTYERLQNEAFEAEMLADAEFAIRAKRLLVQIENRARKSRR
jgi:hypothetical protein